MKSTHKKNYFHLEKNKNFKFLSFPTISGSGPNGAIIHYKATKDSNRKLKNGDIYLVDSEVNIISEQQMLLELFR